MDTQKVRDLSTAQSPKATDFVMLITNLTNNVLEKCQISALRDLLTTNSISDDEDNALTTGSDDKLYVPDLTENIGIVASNLNDLSDDVNTVTNNLNALTGQVGQIQTKVNNVYSLISPDYSRATTLAFQNNMVIDYNGWLNIQVWNNATNGTAQVNINGNTIAKTIGGSQGGIPGFETNMVIVSNGDILTGYGSGIYLTKIPFKGV